MNLKQILLLVIVLSLVATACNLPGSGGGDQSGAEAVTSVTVDPSAGSVVPAVPGDPCAGFDPFDVLNARGDFHISLIESLGIPSSYMADKNYFEVTQLGADGALAVARDLVSGATFCDFVISPAMAEAIDAAVASTNSGKAIEDLIAKIGEGSGELGIGMLGSGESALSPDPLAEVRVLVGLSAAAEANGDTDGAAEAMDRATETFSDYASGVIDTSTDEGELITVAAQAALLGLEELSDEALGNVADIVEKNLEAAAAVFTKCSNDRATVQEFFRRLAQSKLLSGGDPYGATVSEWLDIQLRRKSGESIPECEGGDFTASGPLPAGWNGTITVHLTSCDSVDWTGDLVAFGTLDSGGAQMSMNSSVPLSVTTDDGKPAGVAHGDFVALFDTDITAGETTGAGHASFDGTVEFVVAGTDSGDTTATLKMNFNPGVFHLELTAAGQTFTRDQPVDWGESDLEGLVTSGGQACDSKP